MTLRNALLAVTLLPAALAGDVFTSFSTGGHTVYHLRVGVVNTGGQRAVFAAAFDGYVLCYTPDGRLIWKTPTGGNRPFDMAAADVDGDGLDEVFVASADGVLYAIDHDGRPLWNFRRRPPLFQVSAARLPDGSTVLLTGGVEQVLYVLSADGQVLRTLETEHCIRHIRTGDIRGDGKQYSAVATANRGLNGLLSLLLIDPVTLDVLWKKTDLGTFAFNSGKRFFSMVILDLDKDGNGDILLSNSWGEHGKIYAFNHEGEQFLTASDERIPNVSYRMNLLHHAKLPNDEFVLGQFGNVLIVYNLDGSCREVLTSGYSYTNATFDEATRTLFLGSAVSGGDGVYALRLDQPGWQAAFAEIRPVGKLARIEQNVARLEEQIARFQRPAYQPEPRDVAVVARRPADRQFDRVHFVDFLVLSQKFDGCQEIWCRNVDRRRRHDRTAEEIIQIARDHEREGRDFAIWAGHGHAAYMPLSTMAAVLEVAPKHLYGFVFAEMEGVDAEMAEVVEHIILPLAELCRQHGGKKVIFRNKNIFYNGSAYLPFWQKVFADPRFGDVLVPALEETSSRTPEMSLIGRMGLWLSGTFESWAARIVTDNACYDRMWEWSSQQVLVHHLRHLVSRASLGADIFLNHIHQGPFTDGLYPQFVPFYDMLEKGVIHVPRREDLLSISSVCLGMKSPPSADYIRHGVNGHHYRYPQDQHPMMVFDRLDTYWGGAPTAPHDFSRYAMRVGWRGSNYLPELPYGLPPMIPDSPDVAGSRFQKKFTTDGRHFYDADGRRQSAVAYRSLVEASLVEAAGRLPIRVFGEVHWAAARLDETHVRVTLIDPGYLDPADRNVEIVLQHLDGVSCRDILSGENLPLEDSRVRLQVPAGIFRIVDVTHR